MAKMAEFIDPSNISSYSLEELSAVSKPDSPMRRFYSGTNIFMTGGTGFMGKVLTEKLLRIFPDINAIYILVRGKKGQDGDTRMDTLYDDPLFMQLSRLHPKFRHKIMTVSGDISLPGLGLDIETRAQLVANVDIVFHVAATVRFDEKLRTAVAINVRATKEVLGLAREMTKLKAVLHTSTAYCNCHLDSISEQFYAPPMPYQKMFELVDACDDTLLEAITPTILGKWPNTYALTKAVAEDVVKQEGGGLPMVVFRPAIVVGISEDPLPGYIDNLYGPTGVLFGAGTGVLKTLHADPEVLANIVPVDMCISAMIASVWDVAEKAKKAKENTTISSSETPIYNYVSSCENPLKWKDYIIWCEKFGMEVPIMKAFWYYSFTINPHFWIHWLYVITLHFFPAMIIDSLRYLQGKEPKMLKVYKKIDKFSNVISYFSTRTWIFSNDNVQSLWRRLDPNDRSDFMFDMQQLKWEQYFYNYIRGCRVFLAHDDLSTVPLALKRWRRLYWIHQAVKTTFALIVLRIAWFIVSVGYSNLIAS